MNVQCPSCKRVVNVNGVPTNANRNDGSDAWTCIRCSAVICVDCYHEHTAKKHPEMLSINKEKSKKDRKKK